MWMEELPNGKYKYVERYTNPLTEKHAKVSITLNSKSRRAWNEAQRTLNERIDKRIAKLTTNIQKKTFEEVAVEWLEKYKHTVKGSTYSTRSYMVDRILNDYLGNGRNIIMQNLKRNHIQDILDDLVFEKKFSRDHVNGLFATLSMIIKYAKERNYISDLDMLLNVSVKSTPKTIQELEERQAPRYLEKDELENVLSTLYSIRPEYAEIFDLQANTGMRISEALALKESDVGDCTVFIKGTLDNYYRSPTKGKKTAPKTERSFRKIDVNQRINDLLHERIKLNKLVKGNKDGYLFVTYKGLPHKLGTISAFLKNANKHFKTNTWVTSHIFRHTHISMLAQEEVPLHVIMERVGHTDKRTTENIYLHVTKSTKDKLTEVLNRI